jgi:hypothetical protein
MVLTRTSSPCAPGDCRRPRRGRRQDQPDGPGPFHEHHRHRRRQHCQQSAPVTRRKRSGAQYDLLASSSQRQHALGGLFDARWFSGSSVFSSTGLGYTGNSGGVSARLESTYTYSDPATLTRYRVGDVINGSLAWSRSVRLGGFQYASDFNLRPDLVRFPTVPGRGNGGAVHRRPVRQWRAPALQPVPPGPFEIRQPPSPAAPGRSPWR